MSRGHSVRTELVGRFSKEVELDFSVAQHIGIGRASRGILCKHVVHDALSVGVGQIDHLERNAQVLSDQEGVVGIVYPRTSVVQGHRIVDPIAHEDADHLVACPLQLQGGHAAVDATGQANYNAHGAKLQRCTFGSVVTSFDIERKPASALLFCE